jgi:hypothetical protein
MRAEDLKRNVAEKRVQLAAAMAANKRRPSHKEGLEDLTRILTAGRMTETTSLRNETTRDSQTKFTKFE